MSRSRRSKVCFSQSTTDERGSSAPTRALEAPDFLRAAMFEPGPVNPAAYCHRPVTVTDRHTPLGEVIERLESVPGDDIIDRDLILLWSEGKGRVITGRDILGRLLRGIARPAE